MTKAIERMSSAGLVPLRIQAEGCSMVWLGMAIVAWVCMVEPLVCMDCCESAKLDIIPFPGYE